MAQHKVNDGDNLPKIAAEHGFRRWETIWDDEVNASLREKRKNPHVLHPGDAVALPVKRRKSESCGTELHHVFEVPTLKEMLRIRVEMTRGVPMAEKPYVLMVDGTEYTGDTTAEGLVEHEIPVNSREGELRIEGCTWPLQIGFLNPVDEDTPDQKISGAQARLTNLGFYYGEINGAMDDPTREAIRQFQSHLGRPTDQQTGELDAETCRGLLAQHGC